MNPRSATAFRLGGADRYEAEADRNQKKILRALSGLGGTPRLEVSRELGRSRIRRSAIYASTLPRGCATVYINGVMTWQCGATYYQAYGTRYVVVYVY